MRCFCSTATSEESIQRLTMLGDCQTEDIIENLYGAAGVPKQPWRKCIHRTLTDNQVGCYFVESARPTTRDIVTPEVGMLGILA